MTRVVVSPEAEADLQQLTDRIADAAGFVVVTNFIDRIVSTVDVLSAIPKAAGRPVPKLGAGLRCHPLGNYNLYLAYDESHDVLQLVRVLHGRRNIDATFFKP